MAGVPGLEPGPKVLETSMLTIDTIPLCARPEPRDGRHEQICARLLSLVSCLFILFVQRMATATATELFELQPVRLGLFVLGRHIVALFALRTLQNNVISRHNTS